MCVEWSLLKKEKKEEEQSFGSRGIQCGFWYTFDYCDYSRIVNLEIDVAVQNVSNLYVFSVPYYISTVATHYSLSLQTLLF